MYVYARDRVVQVLGLQPVINARNWPRSILRSQQPVGSRCTLAFKRSASRRNRNSARNLVRIGSSCQQMRPGHLFWGPWELRWRSGAIRDALRRDGLLSWDNPADLLNALSTAPGYWWVARWGRGLRTYLSLRPPSRTRSHRSRHCGGCCIVHGRVVPTPL